LQPLVRAVPAAVAVLERDGDVPGRNGGGLAYGRLAVIGMDQIQVRGGQQVAFAPSEHARPDGVQTLEVAVGPGDAEHVLTEREETCKFTIFDTCCRPSSQSQRGPSA
jgi:hypothetical protein